MAYQQNLKKAARRHYTAAELLYNQPLPADRPSSVAVAGYLFGLAGELAVKQIMRDSGIKPLADEQRRDDPYFAHFPQLKTLLTTAQGRRSGELCKIANNQRLFAAWDISMRYADTASIRPQWVDEWRDSAKDLVDRMEAA